MRTSLLSIFICILVLLASQLAGCEAAEKPYGVEQRLTLPVSREQVWAVAPAINLSGETGIDPLLQADVLFAQLQTVRGIRAVPVNRVAEAYAALGIAGVASPEQAQEVCAMLGVDALVVPTVTLYDPYDPPTMGASLQIFAASGVPLRAGFVPGAETVRDLTRQARPAADELGLASPEVARGQFLQQAGVFDASHGSVRRAASAYAQGRSDPNAPGGDRTILLVMDQYAGFVYHVLLSQLMDELRDRQAMASGSR